MLDPSSSFVRFGRLARLFVCTCTVLALMIWPIVDAFADDPNQAVTTGFPLIDAILKVIGAVYAVLSLIVVILPKTSKLAQVFATIAVDSKGVVAERAAVKEAKTGAMAERIRRESSMPPPRDTTTIPPPASRAFSTLEAIAFSSAFALLALMALAILSTDCKTNPARTACDIVHIVDEGCDIFVQVPLPDGTVEKVPRAEIVKLAKATKTARLSGGGALDGGAP
jgi:hypothetical protein